MVSGAKLGHSAGKANGNTCCFCDGKQLFLLMSIIRFNMNTTENLRQAYQSPALRVIPVKMGSAICGSPVPGGNEDIGYEDWD
jgi:hypothetical protein